MKRIIFLTISLIITALTYAQVPQSFSYQGVARNYDGTPVANKQITVEVTILQGNDCSSGCQIIWQELHYPITNEFGVFSIEIGKGQNTFAGTATSFDNIDWLDRTNGDYYLRIRVDLGTGDFGNYMVDLGTVQLLSVPYAITAQQAQTLQQTNGKVNLSLIQLNDVNISSLANNHILFWNGTQWTNNSIYNFLLDSLYKLADVQITNPTANQLLLYNGSNWINSNINLENLQNVTVTSPTAGNVLSFNGTNWINKSLTLSDLTDISLNSPTSNQALIFNGSNWTNQTMPWLLTASAIKTNSLNPIVIHASSAPTGAVFYDSIGTNSFVINYTYNTTAAVDSIPGTNLIFNGAKANIILGINSQTTLGSYNFLMGYNNLVFGSNNIAFGSTNYLSNTFGLVFGSGNNIDGNNYNIVFGSNNKTITLSGYNLIMGNNNHVQTVYSATFGENHYLKSSGYGYNLAVGYGDTLNAKYSAAIGLGLQTNVATQLVIGKYNQIGTPAALTWGSTDSVALFIIGNGSSATARSNAMVVTNTGDVAIAGNIFTGNATPPKKTSLYKKSPDLTQTLNTLITYYNPQNQRFELNPYSLKRVFPQSVIKFNNNYAIAYNDLVPFLIAIVKMQQQTINDQQQKINQLEQKISDLELRLQKIEALLNQ